MLALTGCKTATENNLSYFRNLGDSPSGVMPQVVTSYCCVNKGITFFPRNPVPPVNNNFLIL